uniref:Uncharacterized protein n=1 Tax=Siphoviridae sp. ctnPP24 TaxID=2825662 RepID=A0A8S5TYU8_9CAUD|nr:MAG TPA: hypothetical protein [Siphoviridae sp. ctnPP24]
MWYLNKLYNALKHYCTDNDTTWTIGDADFYMKYDESFCDFYIFPKDGHSSTCWVTIFDCPKTNSETKIFLGVYAISTAKKSVCYNILGSLPPDFYVGVNKYILGEKLYHVIDKTHDKLRQRMLT